MLQNCIKTLTRFNNLTWNPEKSACNNYLWRLSHSLPVKNRETVAHSQLSTGSSRSLMTNFDGTLGPLGLHYHLALNKLILWEHPQAHLQRWQSRVDSSESLEQHSRPSCLQPSTFGRTSTSPWKQSRMPPHRCRLCRLPERKRWKILMVLVDNWLDSHQIIMYWYVIWFRVWARGDTFLTNLLPC